MAPTRRPSDEVPDDLRLQKDEPDSPPLFAEENRPAQKRPAEPPASRKPAPRDPLDVPLDEPLDDSFVEPIEDPIDDFRMIEPGDKAYSFAASEGTAPPPPTGPGIPLSIPAKRPAAAPSSPAARRRAPRPAAEEVVPRKWLLPVGIGLTVAAVVGPLILVLLLGTSSSGDNSSLPPYAYSAPFQPMSMPSGAAGAFPRVYTPGQEAEPKTSEIVAAVPNQPVVVVRSPQSLATEALAVGNSPTFRPISPQKPLNYTGKPMEVFDTGSPYLSDVCIGGRGRYLFATAMRKPNIFVIDLSTGLLERTIPFQGAQFSASRIAAGADVLVAVDASNGIATSWKMGEFDAPLATVELKLGGIGPILIGSETNGPLVVNYKNPANAVVFLDPTTLKRIRYNFSEKELAEGFLGKQVRSIDSTGTLISTFSAEANPPNQFWTIESDAIARKMLPHYSPDKNVPALSADGNRILTLEGEFALGNGSPARNWIPHIFSGKRNYSIEAGLPRIVDHQYPSDVDLWNVDGRMPFASLKNDAVVADLVLRTPTLRPSRAEGVFYVGRSRLVVMMERGRLLFWHANPANQKPTGLADNDPSKLPFGPPKVDPKSPTVVPDPELAPKVIGRQGRSLSGYNGEKFVGLTSVFPMPNSGVKYEIIKGPVGMKIDESGRIEWATPLEPSAMEYDVIVRIYDENKKFDLTDTWKIKMILRAKPK